MAKILISETGKTFYVADISKDFHCQFGYISCNDLKKKAGSLVKSNTGSQFMLVEPTFKDLYNKIKRGPQIIPLKDVSSIVAQTGIGKNSFVVDAGTGSGALCCFIANIAKKVVSYEIREDFAKISQSNKEFLQLKNLTIKVKSVFDGIEEKNVDVIIYDLPSPWDGIKAAITSLKPGGFLVSYSPTIPQVADFVKTVKESKKFVITKTIEVFERDWEVDHRKIRPLSQAIGHSGFLTFARKIA